MLEVKIYESPLYNFRPPGVMIQMEAIIVLDLKIVVICSKCGSLAPYTLPDPSNPFGVWHWDKPCRKCGANAWVAHDTARDIRTGRIRTENT